MKFKIFLIFIIIWFFRGFISEYLFGLSPSEENISDPNLLKIFIELPIYLLFISSIKDLKLKKPYLTVVFPVLLYLLLSLISAYLNNLPIINAFKYSRYLIYSLMLYFISYSTLNTPLRITITIKVIFILTFIQIVVSIINYMVYGIVEGRIGTIALAFGDLATIFSLTMTAYVIAYYLTFSNRIRWLLFSFLLLLIGLASGKRSLIFTLPFFIILFILISIKFKVISTGNFFSKYIFRLGISLLLILPLINFYIGVVNFGQESNFANYNAIEKIGNIINFAEEYEEDSDAQGFSRGRTGTNLIILKLLLNNELDMMGLGPMKLYDEDTRGYGSGYTPKNILYGIVGWSRDTLSIGFFSVILIVWYMLILFRKSVKIIKLKDDIPDQILFIGLGCFFSLCIFFFDYFFYSANSFISGYPLFLITLGLGIVDKHVSIKNSLDFVI